VVTIDVAIDPTRLYRLRSFRSLRKSFQLSIDDDEEVTLLDDDETVVGFVVEVLLLARRIVNVEKD